MSRVESLRVIAIARNRIPNQLEGRSRTNSSGGSISFTLDEPRMNHIMIAPGRAEHMQLLLQPFDRLSTSRQGEFMIRDSLD
jgi:hypothetical protein